MATARSFELVATFASDTRAQRAISALKDRGMPERKLRLVSKRGDSHDPARVAGIQAEMQEEVTGGWGGPSIGFFTPDQAGGAFGGVLIGSVAGLVVGAAAGAVWAYGLESDIAPLGRLLIATLSVLVAFATIGFIVGGALKPRLEASKRPGRMLGTRRSAGVGDAIVEVQVDDDEEAAATQRVLEEAGALRVDPVDQEGGPMPPQAEHPRPADPPGWWRDGGSGHG